MLIKNLKDCPQHLETLARWHHIEWQHLNPGQSLQDRINRMQDYLNEDFLPASFVALDEHHMPLGSAAIVEQDMETRPEYSPWLASVYVSPPHRQQGIGGELIRYAMHAAAQNQIAALYLFTENQANYYERLGWQLLEQALHHQYTVTIMSAHFK